MRDKDKDKDREDGIQVTTLIQESLRKAVDAEYPSLATGPNAEKLAVGPAIYGGGSHVSPVELGCGHDCEGWEERAYEWTRVLVQAGKNSCGGGMRASQVERREWEERKMNNIQMDVRADMRGY